MSLRIELRYDEQRPCPKCHWSPVSERFCTQQMPPVGIAYPWHPFVAEKSHIHRTCGRCSYAWLELAMDTPELTEDEAEAIVSDLRTRFDVTSDKFHADMIRIHTAS